MANFTPQQIEEFLQEFFDVVGARQYVGARYVPIFGRAGSDTVEWDDTAPYEPLTVVMHDGVSYVSRRYVPAGIQISDTAYWVQTYRFNAQVEQYRQEVLSFQGQIDDVRDELVSDYVPFPDSAHHPKYGTTGQVLGTLTDGTTIWQDPVVPSDEQAEAVITSWLDDHPEATTTVLDGAITTAKLADGSVTDAKLAPNGVLSRFEALDESASDGLAGVENIIYAGAWAASTNPATTNNNDGTFTYGTTEYGRTLWGNVAGGKVTLPAGTYAFFGSPYGYTFVSTENELSGVIARNTTGRAKLFTLEQSTQLYLGLRLNDYPSNAFTVTPYLVDVATLENREAVGRVAHDTYSVKAQLDFEPGGLANESGQPVNGQFYRLRSRFTKASRDLYVVLKEAIAGKVLSTKVFYWTSDNEFVNKSSDSEWVTLRENNSYRIPSGSYFRVLMVLEPEDTTPITDVFASTIFGTFDVVDSRGLESVGIRENNMSIMSALDGNQNLVWLRTPTTYSTSAWTNNNDGTYTIGTGSYGRIQWGYDAGPLTLDPGVYSLYGVPEGYSYVTTNNELSGLIASNAEPTPYVFTLAQRSQVYVGFRNDANPAASFVIAPSLTKVATVEDSTGLGYVVNDTTSVKAQLRFEPGGLDNGTGQDFNPQPHRLRSAFYHNDKDLYLCLGKKNFSYTPYAKVFYWNTDYQYSNKVSDSDWIAVTKNTVYTIPAGSYFRVLFEVDEMTTPITDVYASDLYKAFEIVDSNGLVINRLENGRYGLDIETLNSEMRPFVQSLRSTYPSEVRTAFSATHTPLSFIHFSDIHDQPTLWERIGKYADANTDHYSFALHTGDYVGDNQTQYADLYAAYMPSIPFLNCVGNHDTYANAQHALATKQSVYEKLFNHTDGWDVTFMTGVQYSMTYYKDFPSAGIRLIVLDNYYDVNEQLTWLTSVMGAADALGYHVITASHQVTGRPDQKVATAFQTLIPYENANVGAVQDTAYDAVIGDFIDGGGSHIVHLCGHEHQDWFYYSTEGVLNCAVACATTFQGWTEGNRVAYTKSWDCLNGFSADIDLGVIKLVRLGANCDAHNRAKNILSYDYVNKQVLCSE